MVSSYREMLQHVTNPGITRNEVTDAINNVLDTVSSSTDGQVLSKVSANVILLTRY
jgi:hypothetical protein